MAKDCKTLDDMFEEGIMLAGKRRKEWRSAVDEVILPEMNQVIKEMENTRKYRGIYAREFKKYENFALVQFWFGTIPTGIIKSEEKEWMYGFEDGAALLFSQRDDGKVQVIAYPFIPILPDASEKKDKQKEPYIGKLYDSPVNITKIEVRQIIESFITWAISTSIFKPDNIESEINNVRSEWKHIDELNQGKIGVYLESKAEIFNSLKILVAIKQDITMHPQILDEIKKLGNDIFETLNELKAMDEKILSNLTDKENEKTATSLLTRLKPFIPTILRIIKEYGPELFK